MYYTIEGSSIHIKGNDFNIIQDKDPKSGDYFKDKNSMIDWAKQFITTITDIKNTSATVTEDTDISAGKEFTVTVTLGEKLSLDATIGVINDSTNESFGITFVDGVGTSKVTIKDAGTYYIMLNDFVGTDTKYFVLHEKNEFPITVK